MNDLQKNFKNMVSMFIVNDSNLLEGVIDDKIDECTAAADGGYGLLARKAADHRHVGGVEQELQNTRQHDGYGEQYHFAEDRPLGHIHIFLAE